MDSIGETRGKDKEEVSVCDRGGPCETAWRGERTEGIFAHFTEDI